MLSLHQHVLAVWCYLYKNRKDLSFVIWRNMRTNKNVSNNCSPGLEVNIRDWQSKRRENFQGIRIIGSRKLKSGGEGRDWSVAVYKVAFTPVAIYRSSLYWNTSSSSCRWAHSYFLIYLLGAFVSYFHTLLVVTFIVWSNERKKEIKDDHSYEAHLLLWISVIRTIIKIEKIIFFRYYYYFPLWVFQQN